MLWILLVWVTLTWCIYVLMVGTSHLTLTSQWVSFRHKPSWIFPALPKTAHDHYAHEMVRSGIAAPRVMNKRIPTTPKRDSCVCVMAETTPERVGGLMGFCFQFRYSAATRRNHQRDDDRRWVDDWLEKCKVFVRHKPWRTVIAMNNHAVWIRGKG